MFLKYINSFILKIGLWPIVKYEDLIEEIASGAEPKDHHFSYGSSQTLATLRRNVTELRAQECNETTMQVTKDSGGM